MFKSIFSRYWPHVLCIVVFLALSLAFFAPLLKKDAVMFQHDIKQASGMSQEVKAFKEKTGEQSLWTNSMFSGMPTYQINAQFHNNYVQYAFNALTYTFGYERNPISSLWMLMTCMFILLLTFGINVWAAAAISIGYGFSSFNIIGIEAGHANKIWTLMYAPLILAGVKLAFSGRYLVGGILTAGAMAINVYANHLQITYYIFIAILVWVLTELVFAIRNGTMKNFLVAGLVLAAGAMIGMGTSAGNLLTTYEYGKESTRGGTELTTDSSANEKGLDYNYIFDDYSNGRIEPFTFLIANFMGGPSVSDLSKDSEVSKLTRQTKGMPTYWGDQRYTAGPFYLGAIICFLFVLGLLLAKNNSTKWWLMITVFLAVSLSMGKNSLFLSDLFFNYFPLYTKFRTPTMYVALVQIMVALLGALGLKALFDKNIDVKERLKKLNYSLFITGGLCLLIAVLGSSIFSFSGAGDQSIPIEDQGFKTQFLEALRSDRISLMQKDAFRSLVLVLIAWAALWAFLKQRIRSEIAIAALAVFILADMWMVDVRYMAKDTYKKQKTNKDLFVATPADKAILQDPEKDYRVMNLGLGGSLSAAFNDATTSYFHKSIGGYHGAKLRRYQELIEARIYNELYAFTQGLQTQSQQVVDSILRTQAPTLNMLNCKYFIIDPNSAPVLNRAANGSVWFVQRLQMAENADQELGALNTIDTKTTAVVDAKFAENVSGFQPAADTTARIQLTDYQPNHLTYESESGTEQLAVFSEIYYPYGWSAYIDGNPAPHFRADYVLRSMRIPAGKHKIEFRFEPSSYAIGEKISLVSCLLLFGGVLVIGAMPLVRRKKETA